MATAEAKPEPKSEASEISQITTEAKPRAKQPLSRAVKIERESDCDVIQQRSKCTAAIDFGTSSLSVAYTTPLDGGETRILQLYKTHERVPNAILLRIEGEECYVEDIGLEAQIMYSKLKVSNRVRQVYFERIKNILYRDKEVNRTTTVTSFTGGSYYLIEVIAFIIKHLKEKLLVDQLKEVYKSTDFDWVITVPAIWKARAKRMMREAAYMAGLTSDIAGITKFTPNGIAVPRPEEVNPDKLSLALEPEVAAIYAQHYSSVVGPPPERYMVVDIGGGTVDITVHDNSSGKVSVILPPMGNTWGGTTINEALSMLLEDIVDDKQFFKFLRQEQEKAHLAITQLCYQEFEDEKKRFGEKYQKGSASSRDIVITLPQAFRNYYMPAKLHEGAMKQGMEYNETDGTLRMSYSLVEQKIFQFTVDGILECVRAAFRELKNKINTVYLVGGFGGCKFVRQKIEEAIGGNFSTLYDNVVCPQLSDLAVVHGAVMWRKDPTIIQSRAADATYGISVGYSFNPSVHDEHYKYFNEEGRLHCSSIFKVFVLKGEMVKDEIYNTTVVPHHQRMTRKSISIYSTTDDGVQYVVDKEGKSTVYKIGQLVLDVPNPDNVPRKDRKIDIFMDFSGTEIKARAQYRITGEEVKTFCDFLSNQD